MSARLPLGLAVFFAAAFGLPSFGSDYWVGLALTFFMWVALVQSWVVLSGLTGYLSLGHAVFYGLGAYLMVLTFHDLPLALAIGLAGLAAGALAALIGWPCLRVRGPYFVMLTFGVAEFVKFVIVHVESSLGKSGRLVFGGPSIAELYYWIVGLALAATAMVYAVGRSRIGAGFRAIREDETAAETMGIPVIRLKLLAFTLSAIIPGMVGAVMVLRSTYFETIQVFNPITSFTIVTIAIIGGSDDVPGPFLGAAFLILLAELLQTVAPEAYMIVLGLLLVLFVLGAPDGMAGRLAALGRRR